MTMGLGMGSGMDSMVAIWAFEWLFFEWGYNIWLDLYIIRYHHQHHQHHQHPWLAVLVFVIPAPMSAILTRTVNFFYWKPVMTSARPKVEDGNGNINNALKC